MRPDTLKNAKSVEELKLGDSERRKDRRSRGGNDTKEEKNDYGEPNKQGIQPGYGKPKGEPDKGRKYEEHHEPSNDRV